MNEIDCVSLVPLWRDSLRRLSLALYGPNSKIAMTWEKTSEAARPVCL